LSVISRTTGISWASSFVGWVGVVQAVNIRKIDQRVGLNQRRNNGGKLSLFAIDDFFHGDGVVFVDDRNCAKVEQLFKALIRLARRSSFSTSLFGNQLLTDIVAVFTEKFIVHEHQFALADCCRGLTPGVSPGFSFRPSLRRRRRLHRR
jgi:hypothetical protein